MAKKHTLFLLPLLAAFFTFLFPATTMAAAGKAKPVKHHHWHFAGPFGTYDKEALQRGYQIYETVCSSCHGLDLLSFRNLGQKGGPFYLERCPEGKGIPDNVNCSNPNENPIVKSIAKNYKFMVTDGPDEYGEIFERPALPSDRFPNPYQNDQLARLANNNALPPDLSLITKARHHGPDYIYSLLIGYGQVPNTVEIAPGQHYNPYYPGDMTQALRSEYLDENGYPKKGVEVPLGGVLAMAQPLYDNIVDYPNENTPETVEQYAADVTEFLMWAAEPKMEERKRMGIITLLYLFILGGLVYWSYRQIWNGAKD